MRGYVYNGYIMDVTVWLHLMRCCYVAYLDGTNNHSSINGAVSQIFFCPHIQYHDQLSMITMFCNCFVPNHLNICMNLSFHAPYVVFANLC